MERLTFLINIIIKILTPPLYSFNRLERYCKTYIEKYPKACLPRWFLAGLYKDFKKYGDAKREYSELQHMGCLTEKDRMKLADVLFNLKDYTGTIEILAPLIDKYPYNKNANWCLGISYMRKDEFHEAIVYFERVIAVGSRRDEDYWHLGFCYDRIGDLEKAKDAYSKGLSINPDSKEMRDNLASIYIKNGQHFLDVDVEKSNLIEAEKAFNKALDINPGDPLAIKLLENIQTIKDNISLLNKLKKGNSPGS
jgi:tetratricopeptide (TPR) repeat protein